MSTIKESGCRKRNGSRSHFQNMGLLFGFPGCFAGSLLRHFVQILLVLGVKIETFLLAVLAQFPDATHHMLNRETFAQVKPGAFLVNMGRGGLVCKEDMIEALRSGTLSGAGLDVFEEQPLSPESPLWHMENVWITPHCTPQVPDREAATIAIIRENARRFEAGEPLMNLMTPDDAVNGEAAKGGWARMMNSGMTKEQIAKLPLEKYLGVRGWSDPSEWM